jgi:NAD(P)-dependent dehydrogenase (short-subunit alcohol dehydrogenase family)
MNRFEGKRVIVTGAASGIGQASAQRMAAEGAHVACLDLQAEGAELTAKGIRDEGGEAFAVECNVADPASVGDAVGDAVDRFGGLDSLCNIAGILHFDHTHELALERWNQVLAVNLTGTFLMVQAALPALLEGEGGNIVNMASTAGLAGHPWTAAYSASKGGVLALTYTLAVEYGKQGLRANAVCPGAVATPMHAVFKLPEGADAKLIHRIEPLDQFRGPDKAASVVAFLASDDAAHINGEKIRVDGGTLA